MLKYELIENTKDRIAYRYFPDGLQESGFISVRKSDSEIIDQTVAPNDDFKWCFNKLYKRIREYIDKDQYEEKGIIAWY